MNYLGQSIFDLLPVPESSGGGVQGPTSSTVNAVPRYSNTAGDELKDSQVLVSDTGAITGSTSITANAITAPSGTLNINAGSFFVTTTSPTGIYMNSASSLLRGSVNGAARISSGPDGATGVETRGINVGIGAPGNITAECDGVFSVTALSAGNSIQLTGNTKITGALDVTGPTNAASFIKNGGSSLQYLMADGSSLQFSANSGNSNFYLYKSHSGTQTPPPPSGFVYYNNAVQKNATFIYIAHITDDAIDVEVFFPTISTLNELYIQKKDSSADFIRYNITGAPVVVQSSYIQIPVSVISFGGLGEISFGSNASIIVSFFTNAIEVLSQMAKKTF